MVIQARARGDSPVRSRAGHGGFFRLDEPRQVLHIASVAQPGELRVGGEEVARHRQDERDTDGAEQPRPARRAVRCVVALLGHGASCGDAHGSRRAPLR